MNSIRRLGIGFVLVVLAFCETGSASLAPEGKFDGFGDLNCEDEMAHLDNFAVTLQSGPADKGVIIFYGGRLFRGRLPKRGEAATRAARLKSYLVQRRGIPADQVTVVDGGYREGWYAELWVAPAGASMPVPRPTISIEKIRFRKGKTNPRDYQCGI